MGKRKYLAKNGAMRNNIIGHIIVALAVSVVVLLLDWYVPRSGADLPYFLLVPASEAQGLLSTLMGAMLTVTIFLYSTTILVLTTYSAQFSPRVVENFLNTRSTGQVFGVFIGGTIYCMVTLFFIRKQGDADTFLVAGTGMLYTLVCLVYFIVFILSVSSAVQVQNLLSSLSKEAVRIVNKFVASREDTVRTASFNVDSYHAVHHVLARADGFFEENDVPAIRGLLRGKDYTIVLYPRMGDFVSANQRIASLYYNDVEITPEIEAGLADALILEERRYTGNDYRFAIQKIVEVALKALSASINDPNTAIYCIRYLGVLAGRLAKIDGEYAVITLEREARANAKIVDQDFIFGKDLRDIFLTIIHYGQEDITVVSAIFEALHTALLVSTQNNKPHIQALASYVFATVEKHFQNPIERQLLEAEMKPFE